VAARRALARLGVPPVAILGDGERVPIWPEGIVGSITHCSTCCAAVVQRSPKVRSTGIDVELIAPLSPEIESLVLLPSERAWILSRDDSALAELRLLFFCAKEAYHKCQFPISRTALEFFDVEIAVNTAAQRFEARALVPGLPECVRHLRGRYVFDEGMVFCGVDLPA
jgi:4'-phosphopantetheinyl transferase EntD